MIIRSYKWNKGIKCTQTKRKYSIRIRYLGTFRLQEPVMKSEKCISTYISYHQKHNICFWDYVGKIQTAGTYIRMLFAEQRV